VLEHVEDLLGAMTVCFSLMKPGARMVHVTDLGGHGFFEDPMPPLDFQVYPDWLYDPFQLSTRRSECSLGTTFESTPFSAHTN
jgi:hypothetical protein